jgi:putative transposase
LAQAFLWSVNRQVRKTAEVSLFGNTYEVDPFLAGRVVELVFDPFDLARIEVRHNGKPMGLARPRVIGRHVHRKARAEQPVLPPPPTGIDYLHLVETEHARADARRINFDALTSQLVPDSVEPDDHCATHAATDRSATFGSESSGPRRDEEPDQPQREAS